MAHCRRRHSSSPGARPGTARQRAQDGRRDCQGAASRDVGDGLDRAVARGRDRVGHQDQRLGLLDGVDNSYPQVLACMMEGPRFPGVGRITKCLRCAGDSKDDSWGCLLWRVSADRQLMRRGHS